VDNVGGGVGLPNEADWEVTAFWDFEAGRRRQFPWGDEWDILKLNSICYWAGRELFSQDHTYKKWLDKATPTPVDAFPQGASPSGMMDALGNVWEWTAERDLSGRFMIKGGAYLNVRTSFESSSPIYRQPGFLAPMIGFRCGCMLA
jgi:formylglycine-generating enzyme required for sulfatase activity